MRRAVRLLICVVLSLMVVGGAIPTMATTFDSNNVVSAGNGNYYPWGEASFQRYQLWFSRGMMAGYTGYIDGITQFVYWTGTGSYDVDVYASTTAVGSGALSAIDPDTNRGANNTLIFSGNLALNNTPTLMIDTNPVFNYDGSGNLLLDFIFHSFTGGGTAFQSVDSNSDFFRVCNGPGASKWVDPAGAIRTQIDFTPVPIPPTSLLIGSGLLGLAGWRRFRKS
jgi:hypothetical protein